MHALSINPPKKVAQIAFVHGFALTLTDYVVAYRAAYAQCQSTSGSTGNFHESHTLLYTRNLEKFKVEVK